MATLQTPAKDQSAPTVFWTPWGPQRPTDRDAQRLAIRRLISAVERISGGAKPASVQ